MWRGISTADLVDERLAGVFVEGSQSGCPRRRGLSAGRARPMLVQRSPNRSPPSSWL
jgi:hypothetical protein